MAGEHVTSAKGLGGSHNGMPFKPYRYRGRDTSAAGKPPAALVAAPELDGGDSIGPDPEWYSELAAEFPPDPAPPMPMPAPIPVTPAVRCSCPRTVPGVTRIELELIIRRELDTLVNPAAAMDAILAAASAYATREALIAIEALS